jgi:hypothetical protein
MAGSVLECPEIGTRLERDMCPVYHRVPVSATRDAAVSAATATTGPLAVQG